MGEAVDQDRDLVVAASDSLSHREACTEMSASNMDIRGSGLGGSFVDWGAVVTVVFSFEGGSDSNPLRMTRLESCWKRRRRRGIGCQVTKDVCNMSERLRVRRQITNCAP